MNHFYGYKHWTLEEKPRCFNVGKGVVKRANSNRSRNHKWHAIVKRYGLRVEVCIGPVSNEEACVWEIQNIELMGTFSTNHSHDDQNDIGCNFTKGGDGSTGCIPGLETRLKMSESHRGNTSGTVMKGIPKTEEHRQAIRAALKGNPRVSAALRGNQHTKGRKIPADEIAKRSATLRLTNVRKRLLRLLLTRNT